MYTILTFVIFPGNLNGSGGVQDFTPSTLGDHPGGGTEMGVGKKRTNCKETGDPKSSL